ncbi:MAG: glycosyltransferase family 4 protein [Bacteroidota bacterium]|nr:glycosyltransferase family 4 protein [Bacteroidota bacterium]
MEILFLTSDFLPNVGGMATHTHELARAHVRNGHTVRLVHAVFGNGEAHIEMLDGITVYRLFVPSATPRLKHVAYVRTVRAVIRHLLESERADILHWHDLTPNCWTTRAFRRRVPLVWTNHTSNYLEMCETRMGRLKIRTWLGHADAVIGPSRELAEKSLLTGVRADRIYAIPNGVDTDKFRPGMSFGVIDKDYGIDATRPSVICPRRLEPKNGVEYLIRAIPLIRACIPGVQFLIVGGGFPEERARFEEFLREKGEAEGVVFTGNVPNTAMPSFYALASVSVLPSVMEATSISGLESMACGLPLVGTKVGGIPEIVEDGVTGILVEPRDSTGIAEAVVRLLRDDGLRETMGIAGRKRAEREFSWVEIARRTADVYRTVMEDRVRRGGR